MEENIENIDEENLEEENITQEEGDLELVEESSSGSNPEEGDSTITDEQILDAIRSVVNEDIIEGDSLSGDQDSSEIYSETSETIDYSDQITELKNLLIETNSHLVTLEDSINTSIIDKPLNEYNINDSLLVCLFVLILITGVIGFIKHFTPKIWK